MIAGDDRAAEEVVAGWDHGLSGSVVRAGRVVHVEHIWSTAVTIDIPAAEHRRAQALEVVRRCTELFRHVDATFSTFKPLSEATLFRNGLTRPGSMSADFAEVLAACQRARDLTRGAFDPWSVPGGFDPSGYVKGWAAGRAGALIAAAGFPDHMVNAGGDIWCAGDEPARTHGIDRHASPAPGGQPEPVDGTARRLGGWRVGIVNPHDTGRIDRVVILHGAAMATSGSYERGWHVLDPRTGRPARAVDSATVIGPDPGMADALASAALVDGLASVDWFATLGPRWSLHVVIGRTAHTYGPAFGHG